MEAWKRRKKKKRGSHIVSEILTSNLALRQLWRRLEDAQDKCICWIFSCSKTSLPVLRSISALGTLQHRFNELAAKFTFHLRSTDPCGHIRQYFVQSDTLTFKCLNHPFNDTFNKLKCTNPDISLKSYLLSTRLDTMEKSSFLAAYIL